jgi:putative pyruvate formate lyase activating enzyme
VIIRHLILPGFLESTRQVLRWFADNAQGRALLSLMTQYTPVKSPRINGDAGPARIPSRYVSKAEYETVLAWCEEFGIEDGYCQELVRNSAWLPDFKRPNPFSSRLSKPVWHWRDGFAR